VRRLSDENPGSIADVARCFMFVSPPMLLFIISLTRLRVRNLVPGKNDPNATPTERPGQVRGVVHAAEARVRVRRVEFLPPCAGCYLYYPQRRQPSPTLRALVDFLLQAKRR
jgi:hypothetical protein